MRGPIASSRRAFTLIELLVVIAILGVLMGLLLAAVQKVRESANRISCANNLKQVALAVHAFHDAQGGFPVNFMQTPDGPYGSETAAWSWLARILPYVEQGPLFNSARLGRATLYQSQDAVATPVKLFLCPSDSGPYDGVRDDAADLGTYHGGGDRPFIRAGVTNYKGVSGANWMWGESRWHNPGTNGSWDGVNFGDGIFYRYDWRTPKRLISITDGTSNTFMIGEDLPAKNQWCSWPYANNANGTCAIGPNARRADGSDFDPTDWHNVYSFRSNHSQGLNFAFADGTVKFIHNSIDLSVYRALATIRGGEVIGEVP